MISKILSFFSRLKLTAILGGILAFMFGWIKILSMQKKELKRENAGHVKKNEIREEIDEHEEMVREEVKDAKEKHDSTGWRDRI